MEPRYGEVKLRSDADLSVRIGSIPRQGRALAALALRLKSKSCREGKDYVETSRLPALRDYKTNVLRKMIMAAPSKKPAHKLGANRKELGRKTAYATPTSRSPATSARTAVNGR
jgi:hypothetical protein